MGHKKDGQWAALGYLAVLVRVGCDCCVGEMRS